MRRGFLAAAVKDRSLAGISPCTARTSDPGGCGLGAIDGCCRGRCPWLGIDGGGVCVIERFVPTRQLRRHRIGPDTPENSGLLPRTGLER